MIDYSLEHAIHHNAKDKGFWDLAPDDGDHDEWIVRHGTLACVAAAIGSLTDQAEQARVADIQTLADISAELSNLPGVQKVIDRTNLLLIPPADHGELWILKWLAQVANIHAEVTELFNELAAQPLNPYKIRDELADIVIRCLDLACSMGIHLPDAVVAKHEKNKDRPFMHGKKA